MRGLRSASRKAEYPRGWLFADKRGGNTENFSAAAAPPGIVPLFKTRSAALCGIDAHPVDVEVDLFRSGMARDFMLVGMPDTAVRESRERIKSALMNSGFG